MEMIAGFVLIIIMIAVVAALHRHKVSHLEKIIVSQAEKITNDKIDREHFAMMIAKVSNAAGAGMIDPKTQLFTAHGFNTHFDNLIAQSKRYNNLFSLVMVEITPSKSMIIKQETIDEKIVLEAANRLEKTIRDADIACYSEKNTFLVLFTRMMKPEVIVHGVERILNELQLPYLNKSKSDGSASTVIVHAGITIYPFDGENKATLLENAKMTLNKAKGDKQSLFQFYQEETQALGKRELQLKSAVKSPEFLDNVILEYRPYYDIKSNEIACIHVVASLKHPELGKIHYDEFLRIAHYSSRLFELYEWMMESAILKFELSSEIKTKPKKFILSFNLKQFEIPHFLEKIIGIIKKLSSNDNEIIMEIEDDEIEDARLDAFKKAIHKLNQSDIPIAIGILVLGHFALSKLNKVHFSYLKIDQKLVKDLGKRQESQAILEHIMMLVNVMNIETLTSGVYTNEQKIILENLGCKIIQGKIFNKQVDESFFIDSETA